MASFIARVALLASTLAGISPAADVATFTTTANRPVSSARVLWFTQSPGLFLFVGASLTDQDGRCPPLSAQATLGILEAARNRPPTPWTEAAGPAVVHRRSSRQVVVRQFNGGRPLAGAEVTVLPHELAESVGGHWLGTAAVSSKAGVATVPEASGDDWTWVRASGYATALAPPGTSLALYPAVPLEGHLHDATGMPLGGKWLRAFVRSPGASGWLCVTQTETDEHGHYRFKDVPEEVRIVLLDPDLPSVAAERHGSGPILDLVTAQAIALVTRFVDTADQPVADVTVDVEQFDVTESVRTVRRVRADADGRIECASLSPTLERTRIKIRTPSGQIDSKVLLKPLEKNTNLGVWRLPPAAKASLEVVDADGRPVAGAEISSPRFGRIGQTDRGGALARELMEGQRLPVVASARGFSDHPTTLTGGGRARVVLRRVATLEAVLSFPDGSAPDRAFLRRSDERVRLPLVEGRRHAGGRFVFRTAGFTANTSVFVSGAEPAELGWLSIGDGETFDSGVVELSEGASVAGRLVDSESLWPLVGATVTAQTVRDGDLLDGLSDATLPMARSGPEGQFRIAGLPEGDIRLWIDALGYAVCRIDSEALSDGNDLGQMAIERGEPLEVSLTYEDRSPASGVEVAIRPGGFDGILRERTYRSNEDGRFTVPRISSGRYAMRAKAGNRYARKLITLDSGQSTLEWRLGRTVVEGVLTLHGQPLAGVPVTLLPVQRGISWAADTPTTDDGIRLGTRELGERPLAPPMITNEAGRFMFSDAGEGPMSLGIQGTGWGAERREVNLPASGRILVNLDLGRAEIKARLIDPQGHVVPGILWLMGERGRLVVSAPVDDDGLVVFYLENLSNARYFRGTDGSARKGFAALTGKSLSSGDVIDVTLDRGVGNLEIRPSRDGHAVPGTQVRLLNLVDGSVTAGRSDRDGRYVERGLMEGHYRLICTSDGDGGRAEVDVGDSDSSVAVDMRPTGRLVLQLSHFDATDPTSVAIRVLDRDGYDRAHEAEALGRSAHFNDNGRYTLPGLEPGHYRVEVYRKAAQVDSSRVDIDDRRSTVKTIRLR